MIIKEHKEQVLEQESTHAIIMRTGEDIIYELVIMNNSGLVKSLATLRTWTQEKIPLTEEELKEL